MIGRKEEELESERRRAQGRMGKEKEGEGGRKERGAGRGGKEGWTAKEEGGYQLTWPTGLPTAQSAIKDSLLMMIMDLFFGFWMGRPPLICALKTF